MTIIELSIGPNGAHGLQSQSHRTKCWLEGWVEVPSELEHVAWECLGHCELELCDGKLVGIVPGTVPPPEPDPPQPPSPEERLEAQVTYTAMMTDTLLEVESDG